MNFVDPIRSRKKIAQIKNLLRGERRFRDLLLFVVGINSALRISDLLTLRIGHFVDEQGRINQRFQIHEQKRGKRHKVVRDSVGDLMLGITRENLYHITEIKGLENLNPLEALLLTLLLGRK